MALVTRFDLNSRFLLQDYPLTNDQLFRAAPSIFAPHPHASRSQSYGYIPTIQVLNGLRREGFQPFMAAQSRCFTPGKSRYTKHMLRLRRNWSTPSVDQEFPEVIMINSHDGSSSYQMMAGVFRIACYNGLVTGDVVQDVRVRHTGKDLVHDVIQAAYTIVDGFERVAESIEGMKATPLTVPEELAFADAAFALRYGEDALIHPEELLTLHRDQDAEDDLWTTFNVVQENLLVRGGLKAWSAENRRMTIRPVQGIDSDVKLNKALWVLAERTLQ
jgi:hypothetical protein